MQGSYAALVASNQAILEASMPLPEDVEPAYQPLGMARTGIAGSKAARVHLNAHQVRS